MLFSPFSEILVSFCEVEWAHDHFSFYSPFVICSLTDFVDFEKLGTGFAWNTALIFSISCTCKLFSFSSFLFWNYLLHASKLDSKQFFTDFAVLPIACSVHLSSFLWIFEELAERAIDAASFTIAILIVHSVQRIYAWTCRMVWFLRLSQRKLLRNGDRFLGNLL